MLSKLIVLSCLLSLSWAQTSTSNVDPMTTEIAPTSTQITPMVTNTPTTNAPTTNAPTTNAPMMVNENSSLSERYSAAQATDIRNNHFYCLDVTTDSFPPEVPNADGRTDYFYWSIFLQYPVLSFLDVRRKTNLLNLIVRLTREGAPSTSPIQSLNESDLCIGSVDHYQVSYYEESVLVRIYFNSIVVTPQNPTTGISIADFNNYFNRGFTSAANNPSNPLVQTFQGRNAIAVEESTRDELTGFIAENFHPGAYNLTASEDPTLRAVVIGTFVGNVTLQWASARENRTQEFANNPRPINYGLEPGDIVFAVFGSVFLAIVAGLTVLGFCIHPFFLS